MTAERVEADRAEKEHICPHYDHYDESIGRDPHPFYAKMRACCPVAWTDNSGGFWAVTSYEMVERIVKDPEGFSSRDVSVPRSAFGTVVLAPLTVDPPAHGPFRKLLIPAFAPRVVARAEGDIRDFVRGLVEQTVADGGCDLAHDFARRIPVFSLARLLDVPLADQDRFTTWVGGLVEKPMHVDPEGALINATEMMGYVVRLVQERKNALGEDLISEMLRSVEDGQRLSEADVVNATFLFILAGIDTTWSVIGASLYHLARHPEDRRRLVEAQEVGDPNLLKTAVEEFLRFYTPASLGRTAMNDVQLGAASVREGDLLQMNFPAANRDPAAFEDADKVLIGRQVNRHLAFGVGIHRCLGSGFARLMIRVSVEEWLRAIPEYHLVDPDDVHWSIGMIWGPRRVAVRVGAA
jgi:cytochrome P450